jgi:GNAT superfamily N-acetyltransferase
MDTASRAALDLRRLPFGDPVVQSLVAELQEEFTRRYGGPDATVLDPAMFDPPAGAFFVGFSAGTPVAMGGWRMRPDVTALGCTVAAEIKRMYVVPAAQRRGHARAVLARLEESARAHGADVLVLESGMKQPEALALYESSGYVPVPGFGIYKDSPLVRYLGKVL